ncbi:MAG: outer membrane beta-barrel protein [candidate division Zixibacteria bacterium]|nr:outer membrane beta-barrel protein [candidate division Zixibacteria bacterium]
MRKSQIFIALALVLALSVAAMAQEDEEEEKWRDFEVTLIGGGSLPMGDFKDWSDTLGANFGFTVGLAAGYYFTERFSAGLYFTYSDHGTDNYDLGYKMYDIGGYLKYAFTGESNWEPYVKLSGGALAPKFATWVTPDRNLLRELSYDPAISLGVMAGVLYYTSDFGGIYAEVGFHNDLTKDVEAEYAGETYKLESNVNYIQMRVGVSVFFGPED